MEKKCISYLAAKHPVLRPTVAGCVPQAEASGAVLRARRLLPQGLCRRDAVLRQPGVLPHVRAPPLLLYTHVGMNDQGRESIQTPIST